MNKWVFLVALLFLPEACFSQTARTHYDEIYKAGGLDRMADQYVCFDDDPTISTFFIFAKSDTLRQFLESVGGYTKLSAKDRAQFNKGFLTVHGYDKGVPLSSEDNYLRDGESWATEVAHIKKTPLRMRFDLSWQTLRYKRSVEILNSDLSLQSAVARYGRCELVPSTVQQRANP